MSNHTKTKFEILYDTYSAMLYGIALEISSSAKQAEEFLIITFKKAHEQNIAAQKYPSHCISLIKLLLQVVHYQTNGIPNLKLKGFKNYPILHSLLCEAYPGKNNGNKTGKGNKRTRETLRAEFLILRYLENKQQLLTANSRCAHLTPHITTLGYCFP